MLGVWLLPSRAGPAQVPGTGETSQVPRKELPHVHKVSSCAGIFLATHDVVLHVLLCSAARDRHVGVRPGSRITTGFLLSPATASLRPTSADPRASLGVGVVG